MKGGAKFVVKGTVQSMFFRTFCKDNADKLNLKGIVRSLENGDVEIIVEGEKTKIEEFFKIIKQGPKYSQIKSVESEERKWSGDLKEFKVLRF